MKKYALYVFYVGLLLFASVSFAQVIGSNLYNGMSDEDFYRARVDLHFFRLVPPMGWNASYPLAEEFTGKNLIPNIVTGVEMKFSHGPGAKGEVDYGDHQTRSGKASGLDLETLASDLDGKFNHQASRFYTEDKERREKYAGLSLKTADFWGFNTPREDPYYTDGNRRFRIQYTSGSFKGEDPFQVIDKLGSALDELYRQYPADSQAKASHYKDYLIAIDYVYQKLISEERDGAKKAGKKERFLDMFCKGEESRVQKALQNILEGGLLFKNGRTFPSFLKENSSCLQNMRMTREPFPALTGTPPHGGGLASARRREATGECPPQTPTPSEITDATETPLRLTRETVEAIIDEHAQEVRQHIRNYQNIREVYGDDYVTYIYQNLRQAPGAPAVLFVDPDKTCGSAHGNSNFLNCQGAYQYRARDVYGGWCRLIHDIFCYPEHHKYNINYSRVNLTVPESAQKEESGFWGTLSGMVNWIFTPSKKPVREKTVSPLDKSNQKAWQDFAREINRSRGLDE